MDQIINKKSLVQLIQNTVQEMKPRLEEDLTGKTLDINEFRKKYCGGKTAEWVRAKIFDRHPEINAINGGWVVNPRRTEYGSKTIIFAKKAAKWMAEHDNEIDWNEKLGD